MIRNQLAVPACTAFAEASAIDHAIGRWTGKPPYVSVMQIWSRYHTATEENALESNLGQPVGAEEDWPFAVNEANSWLACEDVDADMKKKYGCGQQVNAAHARTDQHSERVAAVVERVRATVVARIGDVPLEGQADRREGRSSRSCLPSARSCRAPGRAARTRQPMLNAAMPVANHAASVPISCFEK